MDQPLCEIENDTPLVIVDETVINENLKDPVTLDSSVCSLGKEASTKEQRTKPPNLLDKAFSIDDTILATPLEPILMSSSLSTPMATKEQCDSLSLNEDSTSEDSIEDYVVVDDSSTMKDGSSDSTSNTSSTEEINMSEGISLNEWQAGGDTIDDNTKQETIDNKDFACGDIPEATRQRYASILRRTSFFDENVPENHGSKRRVSFPNENCMVSYKEPEQNLPWTISTDLPAEEILAVYQKSCKKHNTIELDVIKNIIQDVKNNTNHSAVLNLSSVKITSEVNETLEDILQIVNFNSLVLYDCKFTPATVTEFLNMIEFYESVCHIEVTMNFEDDDTWRCFCNACSNINVLESITFKGMDINDSYMRSLIHTIRTNRNITTLKFDGCTLGKLPSFYLIENLMHNTTVRELYIPSTGLYTKEADIIGRFLQLNNHLKVLDISNNYIGDRGLEVLAKGLVKQNVPGLGLSVLVIFNNQITEKSGPIIKSIIKECKNLLTLNIGYNNLTDEVLLHISEGLRVTNSLEGLGLQCTLLTCKGIHSLAEAIQNNKSLQKINLKGNKGIQISGVEKLCKALTNTKITKIEIDETNRTCNDPDQYKQMVKQMNEICTVNRNHDQIDEEILNISQKISRKVSLSCEPRFIENTSAPCQVGLSPIPSPISSPAPKSRFSISRVAETSISASTRTKSRFKVTRVLPSPEEEEPVGRFANVRSSVSSNDSMDSLTTLPLDTDSDNEH